MRRVLNLLGASEGCIGAFVTQNGECVASTRMVGIGADRMQLIEGIFRQLTADAKERGYGMLDFFAHFPAASILCYHLTDDAALIVLGMPGSSLKRLEARSASAANELRPSLQPPDAADGATTASAEATTASAAPPKSAPPTSAPPPLPADATGEPPHATDLAAARELAHDRFGERLDQICNAFISHVGPLGRLLFDKYFSEWLQTGPADWSRAAELRERLAHDIENVRDAAAFESLAAWKG
ncbi:MAG: hypothetical protein R3F39_19065 [Myxococcota bacterium]